MIILAILVSRRYGGGTTSQLSIFPLVISVLIILEAVFGLLRINAVFPIWGAKAFLGQFIIYSCLGSGLLISAYWIFALNYHKTATATNLMLTSDLHAVSADSVMANSVKD